MDPHEQDLKDIFFQAKYKEFLDDVKRVSQKVEEQILYQKAIPDVVHAHLKATTAADPQTFKVYAYDPVNFYQGGIPKVMPPGWIDPYKITSGSSSTTEQAQDLRLKMEKQPGQRFGIGAKVKLNPKSVYYSQFQYWNGYGTVDNYSPGTALEYHIIGASGYQNSYGEEDLILCSPASNRLEKLLSKIKPNDRAEHYTTFQKGAPRQGDKVWAMPGRTQALDLASRKGNIEGVVVQANDEESSVVRFRHKNIVVKNAFLCTNSEEIYARLNEIQEKAVVRERQVQEEIAEVAVRVQSMDISRELYSLMAEMLEESIVDTGYAHTYPQIIVLGGKEGEYQVRAAVRLPVCKDGCYAMPRLDKNHMTKAYIQIAKLGLVSMGVARVGYSIGLEGYNPCIYSGHGLGDLYQQGATLLTFCRFGVFAQAGKNRFSGTNTRQSETMIEVKVMPIKTKIYFMSEDGLISKAPKKAIPA